MSLVFWLLLSLLLLSGCTFTTINMPGDGCLYARWRSSQETKRTNSTLESDSGPAFFLRLHWGNIFRISLMPFFWCLPLFRCCTRFNHCIERSTVARLFRILFNPIKINDMSWLDHSWKWALHYRFEQSVTKHQRANSAQSSHWNASHTKTLHQKEKCLFLVFGLFLRHREPQTSKTSHTS